MKRVRVEDILIPPKGANPRLDTSRVRLTEIPMGPENITTCNITLADLDGDGLQEIATVLTAGEEDAVRAYRGSGELLWESRDVRLYHAYYGDREPNSVRHMWYRCRHRHVLTEAYDWDGDGNLEVIAGDGPIYILDGQCGKIKQTIDLNGSVPLWTVVAGEDGVPLLVATVARKEQGGRLVGVRRDGEQAWSRELPGQDFCDCMHAGTLGTDDRTVIGFSMDDPQLFRVVDVQGQTLWEKSVPQEIGDDRHVDDFVFARVLPDAKENQMASATGSALLGGDGTVLWSLRDVIDHGQAVRAGRFMPSVPGLQLFFVASFDGRATLASSEGRMLWTYQNFTRVRPEFKDRIRHRLTTAMDLIHWSGSGADEIVHGEILSAGKNAVPDEAVTLYLTILDGEGRVIERIPYSDDAAAGFIGNMCVRRAHVTRGDADDIVAVTHNSSKILIYSRTQGA